VAYDKLTADSMVIVDLDGKTVDGTLRPSSDTKTHQVLYRAWGNSGIKSVIHTHSTYAVAWAQAKMSVPVYGTTHADHGAEEIPCTDYLSREAVLRDYETETGNLIVDTFKKLQKDPVHMQMVLVAGHGPFAWGDSAEKAVYNAAVLEEVCKMGLLTLQLKPNAPSLPDYIIKKHWDRKHGANAYYGQK
jgi:L-ribulose-5-phosphate 4-epimerase